MSNEQVYDFQCSKCGKRLKAAAKYAGKRVKCPKCQQPATVPGVVPSLPAQPLQPGTAQPPTTEPTQLKPVASLEDDWLNLGGPAIADASTRQQEFEEKKAAIERERISKINKQRERRAPSELAAEAQTVKHKVAAQAPSTLEDDDDFSLAPLVPKSHVSPASSSAAASSSASTDTALPKRSVFEDDLPDLAELEPRTQAASKESKLLARHVGVDSTDLDELGAFELEAIPLNKTKSTKSQQMSAKGALSNFPKLLDSGESEEVVEKDPQYRILCAACGTAQYVRVSNIGMKIKCPDCYLEFKIPPPPPNWSPKKQKLKLSNEDMPLAAAEELQHAQTADGQRTRASQILEKAEQQVTDDDLERLYDGDFDTAGFLQSTFGFLKDPIAIAHIVAYAIVFAGIFAIGQFAANNHETQFGRGVLLLAVIGAPVVGVVFAMPMLSSGLALLESVANRQKRVAEWPGFNIFENGGDMIATTLALLAAMVPGFLVGAWLGGEAEGAGRIQIAGMMVTTFLLFPVFLLSMLDNGSVFAPLSTSIFRSFSEAVESWAAYFLKTFLAFSSVMMLWLLLLGKSEVLAGLAGCLFPVLVFFTCQQLGALADGISEHLSFEFTPPSTDDEEEADNEGDGVVLPGLDAERKRTAIRND